MTEAIPMQAIFVRHLKNNTVLLHKIQGYLEAIEGNIEKMEIKEIQREQIH